MFDLFRSRAKATRYLLGGLLLLVALSMVITLIPGFGTPGSNDAVVAQIGSTSLTALEVQQNVQRALREKSIPADLASALLPQFIDEMIADRAIEYEASQHGLQVTDAEVATTIRTLIPQLYQDGKYVGDDALRMFLSQYNMTIEQFEAGVRRDMIKTKFQNLALEGMVVTPQEVEREFRAQNLKAKIEYIVLSDDKYRAQAKVSPEELQAYFKSHSGQFKVPEKRDGVILVADKAKVEAGVNFTDEQLRQMYNQDKERFRVPDRVHVRHILLKTMGKSKDEEAKLQGKAEDLLKQIKANPASFEELAKKYSEDPGSATKGGDLDWITRGQTVPNFEKAAFSLQPKELSSVIKTEYGFHIIQVLEKDTARVKPFEEVKESLATERKGQMVMERMQGVAEQARAQLAANPGQAQQIAQKFGLQFETIQGWSNGAALPMVGTGREAQDAMATLAKGEVSQLLQPVPDKLAIVEVTNITPSRGAELNEVEAQVREAALGDKAHSLLLEKVRAADAALKSGGLAAASKAAGVDVKTSEMFTSTTPVEGLGSPQGFLQAFTQPVGSTFGPINLGGRILFAKVAGREEPNMALLSAQRDEMVLNIKKRKAQVRKDLLDDGIINMLKEKGKLKIHQDVIDRIVGAYRSS